MSIITAILNAILQAIGWIFPISESGHSAIYHDFSGQSNGSVWLVTGVVHIGIAVGIVLASFSVFKLLSKEFGHTVRDLFKGQLKIKGASPGRNLLYMAMISFLPLFLWLIPIPEYGNLYMLIRSLSFNGTILDEGLLTAITGLLLYLSIKQMSLSRNDREITLPAALVVGFSSVFLVPAAGLSLTAGVFCILILFGVKKNISFRYSLVMSVPVLLVIGISEIVLCEYTAGAVEIILAAIISIAASFICVRVYKFIIKKMYLVYFSYYDFALGALAVIIGGIQLIVRN